MTEKTALLIIDLQEDFLPPNGSLAVANGREIINPIIDLLTPGKYKWDAIIASKDWHTPDHISFAKTHNQEPYSTKLLSSPNGSGETKLHTLWPVHCVQKSHGSEFPHEFKIVFDKLLEQQNVPTKIVLKGYLQDREYYSCFKDVWGIHKTECYQFLKDNCITNVVAVGIAYDFCVMNSCIDSADFGFKTYVIKDLTRGVYPDKDRETTLNYENHGITVITSESDVMKKWIL
ncbi:NAD(+) salvage pathway protein [Pichia californica]|uniref:nicotinamidase n=1 Tax=Pichia californica TaxID=460514 RepID=A0A9P7BGJ3_9ASCO|nr:NAD(+) salvage pathway protein [[Candida] californica]KAG0688368.1 NAD(+) salvage pathway protein [[Candida] californica]